MNIESTKQNLNEALNIWDKHVQNKDMTYPVLTDLLSQISRCSNAVLKHISQSSEVDNQKEVLSNLKTRIAKVKTDLQQVKNLNKLGIKALFSNGLDGRVSDQFKNHHLIISDIERKLHDIEQHKMIVDHFLIPPSFKGKLKKIFPKMIDFIFSKIKNSISQKLFMGDKSSYNKELVTKLKNLIEKDKVLEEKAQAYKKYFDTKLDQLAKKQAQFRERLNQTNDNLEMSRIQSEFNQVSNEINAIKEKLAKLQNPELPDIRKNAKEMIEYSIDGPNKISPDLKNVSLQELSELEMQINGDKGICKDLKEITDKLKKLRDNADLGRKMRQDLHALGGESVKMQIADEDATLDGMYISADKFKQALSESGGLMYDLKVTPATGEKKAVTFKGICFPKAGFDNSAVNQHLKNLGVFPDDKNREGTWLKIEYGNQILLMEKRDHQQFELLSSSSSGIDFQTGKIDLTPNPKRGTAIITSGNAGVYEMHKREIMSFLIKGVNVMAFNFRGYGESTGKPSTAGLKQDMEVAYQYIKEKTQVPDNKILLKALCMSGGPATYLAAKHPEINLFLDQSYADFTEVVKEMGKPYIEEFLKKQFPNPDTSYLHKMGRSLGNWLSKKVMKLLFNLALLPDWNTQAEIRKIKGHVGLLFTEGDTLMTVNRDIYQNYKALIEGKQAKTVSIASMPGAHGNSWLSSEEYTIASQEEARDLIEDFKKDYPKVEDVPMRNKVWYAAFELGKTGISDDKLLREFRNQLFTFWEDVTMELKDKDVTPQLLTETAERILKNNAEYASVNPQYHKNFLDFVSNPPYIQKDIQSLFLNLQKQLINSRDKSKDYAQKLIEQAVNANFMSEDIVLAKQLFFKLIKIPEQSTFVSKETIQREVAKLVKKHSIFGIPIRPTKIISKYAKEVAIQLFKDLDPQVVENKLTNFWQDVKREAMERSAFSGLPSTDEDIEKIATEILGSEDYQNLDKNHREVYMRFIRVVPKQITALDCFESLQKVMRYDNDTSAINIYKEIDNLIVDYPSEYQEIIKNFLLKLMSVNTHVQKGKAYVDNFLKRANLDSPLV